MAEPLPWIEAPLRQALQQARGHALLIHGPRGVGQFELAMAIAAAWLCETRRGAAPACGDCAGCRLLASRTHPDLQVLLPEALQLELGWTAGEEAADGEGGKRKPSKDIRIEQVRAAIGFTQQTTARGGPKVVVMFPAERMNAASASALLKTLEEPPGQARLLLASAAAQRLLPTVRSRCQALRLAPPSAELAQAWLAGQGAAEPAVLLAAAGGQPLEALDRLAQGLDAAAWRRLPREVIAGQSATLAAWPLPLAVDALLRLCHDALAVAVDAAPRYFPAEIVPRGGEVPRIAEAARELLAAASRAEHPWNAALAVEALVQRTRRALLPGNPGADAGISGRPLATLAS
ncbi:MAG TPA: DNA polymerase III subunit delta' [Methylibium sp.]|nr:DNA polymerase III subunit delta' [Methylibium sp.]